MLSGGVSSPSAESGMLRNVTSGVSSFSSVAVRPSRSHGNSVSPRLRSERRGFTSVVLTRPGRLAWWDTTVPATPGPGGAVVMPLAIATCDLDRPVGLGATPFPLPLHFGHECVGEVLAVGEAVGTGAAG
jgi:hypothetical protein